MLFVSYVFVGLLCLATTASVISCSSVRSSEGTIMCLESERKALLMFKQGLADKSNALASWKSEKDCCKWRGIVCNNQTGHVTGLDLSAAAPLRGDIHPSLLALRYLNYLDLSYNDFGGMMIPKFIGSLSRLKQLRLVDANFSGQVPPHLGNLSTLETLDLSDNFYVRVGNLEWLSHLSSLRYLSMSYLHLSNAVNWPLSLSKLTSLTELRLSLCNLPDVNLRSLPYINSSTSLQLLDLSSNWLNSSIFYWIANVSTNFVDVQLSGNQLQGHIPANVFTKMHSLVSLDMSHNDLESGIPENFQNLCNLVSLDLSFNPFSENIEDLFRTLSCAHNTFEVLDLTVNELWGSLPDFTGFAKLRVLDLDSNKLNGSVPKSLGQLSSLEQLSLSDNSLTGALTESFFQNLPLLETLDLSGNNFSINLSSDWIPPFQLTGRLYMSNYKLGPGFPKWILAQTNLTQLYLSNCGLSGSLPHEFSSILPSLNNLDLSMNQLHGNFPNLTSSTILDSVDLSSNLFSGVVPLFSRNLSELSLSNNTFSELSSSFCVTPSPHVFMIDISKNLLSGVLPDCWMQFEELSVLNLKHNKLSGKLPSSLGHLRSLNLLLLNHNNFSGELPSLEKCSKLWVIDLGSNKLSGNIPTWIGQSLSKLAILSLRSNEFTGIIHFSLCGLGIIHVFDLSHNNLSGALPHCFNNITALTYDHVTANKILDLAWKGTEIEFGFNLGHLRLIDISSNSLIGEIPDSITSMQNLISFNLSRNKLTGKLPEMFGNMTELESLDLSRNQISGSIPSSFTSLNFLEVLDLSYNKLVGRIPQSTQLQSFNASTFAGNLGLCGPPLSTRCPGNQPNQPTKEHIDDDGLISWGFIMSLVLGFITGFWTVCGSLLLKRSWRHAYFRILNNAQDLCQSKCLHTKHINTAEPSKMKEAACVH